MKCSYCGLSYDYAVCPFDGTRLVEPSAPKCQNPEGVVHSLADVPKKYLQYQEYVRLSPFGNLAACPNCRTPYFYASLPQDLQKQLVKKVRSEGCFIATAAMGSHLHPHIQSLRTFRDDVLLKSRHKTSFENLLAFYYRFSPPVARVMSSHMMLKSFLRYILVYPLVLGIKAVLPLFDATLGISRDADNGKNRSEK